MNTRKNQNSLLVLATLGVYLGLVLAGATPQVLAQQTATNKYHRTSISDDLYVDSVVDLLRKLDYLSKQKKFDWNVKTEFSIESLSFDPPDDFPAFLGAGSLNQQLQYVIENASLDIGRRLFSRKADLRLGDFYTNGRETIDINFLASKAGLRLDTKINTDNEKAAKLLGDAISEYLTNISLNSQYRAQKVVAENTKSKVEDTHVFLSTHLARSSIPLLAKNAK